MAYLNQMKMQNSRYSPI